MECYALNNAGTALLYVNLPSVSSVKDNFVIKFAFGVKVGLYLLSNKQYGFIKGRSTMLQLYPYS